MKKQYALITGANGHIGREVCHTLAKNDISIIMIDKYLNNVEDFKASLQDLFQVDVLCFETDLADKNSFGHIKDFVRSHTDTLDYVVNNAAFYDDMSGWGVDYEYEGYDAWMKVFQVNLIAPFFLVQALTSLLQKSSNASIVNVSSLYGVVAPDFKIYEGLEMTNPCAYGVSKAGICQLSRWLASCLSPNIRVNTVTPGGIERGQNETFVERYNEKTLLNRMGTEEDIAKAIYFLLSSDSSYITGQNIIVDGGWTAL